MIVKLYSVKDKLVEFGGPIAFKDEKVAKRWFMQLLASKKANFEDPKDFDLYCVGSMDTEKGNVIGTAVQEVELILKGESIDV